MTFTTEVRDSAKISLSYAFFAQRLTKKREQSFICYN